MKSFYLAVLLLISLAVGTSQAQTVVPYNATSIAFSSSNASSIVTLTGDMNTFSISSGTTGQQIQIEFCQDSIGGHQIQKGPSNFQGDISINQKALYCTQLTVFNSNNAWKLRSKVIISAQSASASSASKVSSSPQNFAAAITSPNINGYLTVDGTTYSTLNSAWTAAAALCTGGATVSPTILLGPGLYKISSPLVEPETSYCNVNLIGMGDYVTTIQPTTTMNAVIYKAATVNAHGITLKGFSIEGTPYVSGTGYVTYATYGILIQWAQFTTLSDLTVSDCGTSTSGEDIALGEAGLPSGHSFGGRLTNISTNYTEGIYTGPQGGSGPTPPAYGLEFMSTAADSYLTVASLRNAQTAGLRIDSGSSDIKTYGVHAFSYSSNSPLNYRSTYSIQDFGSLNTHTSPIFDSFHYAGIDMGGSYDTVIGAIWEWVAAPDTTSALFTVETAATFDTVTGGNCQALAGMVSTAYIFVDGHNVSIPPSGWKYEAPTGCLGLFSYEWEDTATLGRSHNYTAQSGNSTFQTQDFSTRNKSASSGSHFPFNIQDVQTNKLFQIDDYGSILGVTETAALVQSIQTPTVTAPTLTTSGTAGSTSYSYECTPVIGSTEGLGTVATIATGNATLSSTNKINITCPVLGTLPYSTLMNVYRTVGGATQGKINSNISPGVSFSDTGITATTTVPTVNTTGRITTVGGLQYLTTGTQPTCSSTSGLEGTGWYTKGSGSTNGVLQICQNQSGTYSWVTH